VNFRTIPFLGAALLKIAGAALLKIAARKNTA
jgi:hypothetical protein